MKKEASVVMLPTDKESASIAYSKQENAYVVASKLRLLEITQGFEVTSLWSWHHLYITDDSEIKEGDWCLFFWDGMKDGELGQVGSEPQQYLPSKGHTLNLNLRKIIATTDPKLRSDSLIEDPARPEDNLLIRKGIPKIPQSLIESYCKNPVDKVMIEYTLPDKIKNALWVKETL